MNDGEIVRRLRQLEKCRQQISDIIAEIETSDHPNARAIADALYEQCWFPAWPEHVVGPELLAHPHRWEYTNSGDDEQRLPGRLVRKREWEIRAAERDGKRVSDVTQVD